MVPELQRREAMQTSDEAAAVNSSDVVGPNGAALVSAYANTIHSDTAKNQQLPSWKYQYSRWHELESATDSSSELRGSMLHSPRVREGPKNVTSMFAAHTVMYSKKKVEWMDHRNSMEDWENAKSVNLSYQELGDVYQTSDLLRCLKRLINCTHLQLTNNSLTDLSKLTLPTCTHLNLARNSFSSFKKLPKAPNLQHLSLASNSITSLSSLSSLSSKYPSLKSLILKGNSVEFTKEYRHKVFKSLPGLSELDTYPDMGSNCSSSSCSGSNSSIYSPSSLADKCIVS